MRSILLAAAFVAATCGAAVSGRAADVPDLGTRKQGVDWPRFLGPTGDGKSSEQGIITNWPKTGPKLVWQMKLSGGYSTPVVSRGRLFMLDRAGDKIRLRCVRSETGQPLWEFTYPTKYEDLINDDHGPRASPLVDDDRVYLFGPDGMLCCLNVADGKELWKLDTAEKFHVVQNFFGVGSSPVIEGDLLIVPIGGSPADGHPSSPLELDKVKGAGSGIVAFDKRTGAVKYQVTDELASYSSPTLATIAGRRWCFVLMRGGLVGFEPTSGKVDFHYPWRAKDLYSVNASTPVVVGDTVFVSEAYQVGSSIIRVHPGGYDVVWKEPSGRQTEIGLPLHWATPICIDGCLYASGGRYRAEPELRCVEAATGHMKWSQAGLDRGSLLYVDHHFVCLTERGRLLLFKAAPERYELVADCIPKSSDAPAADEDRSGELLAYPAWSAPILSRGLLYLRGKDRLICLELIPERR